MKPMTHPINADGTIDFDEGMPEHILYDTGVLMRMVLNCMTWLI